MKILITPRSFASTSKKPMEILEEEGYEIIRNDMDKPYQKEEMLNLVEDIDGIIIGIDQFDREIIDKANKLKVISKYGTGYDQIDIDYAAKKGIPVTITPTANINAVADLAFGLIIGLARRIPEADRIMRKDQWQKVIGHSVWKKNLGIIGLGKIGKQVLKRAEGFNMNVLAFDVDKDKEFNKKYEFKYVKLNELLEKSDFVTIHTPLNKNTKDLITIKELKKMKKDSYIINTSRGGIVNEKDLLIALKENEIAGAALDAFEDEPPEDDKFKNLENVILTPHIGGYTDEAIENMGVKSVKNLIDTLKGKESKYVINK